MGVTKESANIDVSSNNNTSEKNSILGREITKILEQTWGNASNVFSPDDSSILKRGDFERQLKEIKERSDFVLSKAEKALNEATAIQLKIDENISSVNHMLENISVLKASIKWLKSDIWNIVMGIIVVIVIFMAGLIWDFFKVRGDDYRAHNEKYMNSLNKIMEIEWKITEIQNNEKNIEEWIDGKISAEINKRIIEFFMKDKQIKITE